MDIKNEPESHDELEAACKLDDASIARRSRAIIGKLARLDEDEAFHEHRLAEIRAQRAKILDARRQLAERLGLVEPKDGAP